MKINKKSVLVTGYGVLIVAACNGKLVVDSGGGHLDSQDGGTMGNGGATIGSGGATFSAGGSATGVGGASAGGAIAANGGADSGGAGAGGAAAGGAPWIGTGGANCQEMGGGGGMFFGAGGGYNGPPTCPVDADGIAAGDLATICGTGPSALGFACPATSTELLRGLTCDEVTTDKEGFTRTVGCGVETIEFDTDHQQTVYAVSYDLSSGALTTVKVRQTYSFGSCNALGYQAGTAPPACSTAVTYRCNHTPVTGAAESAYAGCRAPNEAGCGTCCSPTLPPYEGYCDVLSYQNPSAQSPPATYDMDDGIAGLCPCGCTPCATCKLADERRYRIYSMPNPASCDCSTVVVPVTGSGGSGGGDPCVAYCSYMNQEHATCPGL